MRAPVLARLALAAAVAAAIPAAVTGATLKLDGGGNVAVGSVSFQAPGFTQAVNAPAPLGYSLVDASGRVHAGDIPGTEGALASEASLAQNPVTGEILLAFPRPGAGGHDVFTSAWLGQVWSEPVAMGSTSGDDRAPLLAFRPSGDALLTWTSTDRQASVLLRHFELAGDDTLSYSFSDVGKLAQLAGPQAAGAGDARVLAVVGAADSLSGYLLVGGAAGPLSVVRVGLDAIFDPGGFGAAPVPVTFVQVASGTPNGLLNGRDGVQGEIFAPWRIVMGRGEAWYWREAGTGAVQVALWAEGHALRLASFTDPGSEALLHVEAYKIARQELGPTLRRPGAGSAAGILRRDR